MSCNTVPIDPEFTLKHSHFLSSALNISPFNPGLSKMNNIINSLIHPNILLYNIVNNSYIMSRIISVLDFNYKHNPDISKFIKEIYIIGLQLSIYEQLKITYLNIMFKKYGLKSQPVNQETRAINEYNILRSINIHDNTYKCHNVAEFNLFDHFIIKPNIKILDIGCGPGNFIGELCHLYDKKKEDLYGLDVVSYVKDSYKECINLLTYQDNFIIPDNHIKYNFISFYMVLHHISIDNIDMILKQLYNKLDNDGYLFIKDHNVECIDDLSFFKFMEIYFYFVEEYIPSIPIQNNYFMIETMIHIFELYGFINVINFKCDKTQPFKPHYFLFKKKKDYILSSDTLSLIKKIINNNNFLLSKTNCNSICPPQSNIHEPAVIDQIGLGTLKNQSSFKLVDEKQSNLENFDRNSKDLYIKYKTKYLNLKNKMNL